ncbi:hypothetical protein BC332_15392 [Capsicum chinense]|nr:hypothetical protein BC332_15392 [Capsicum chinense]
MQECLCSAYGCDGVPHGYFSAKQMDFTGKGGAGGNGNGGGRGIQPLGVAKVLYSAARISVWWDIENYQVPRESDPHEIAQNISFALVNMNYCVPVLIFAYGDTTKISAFVQQALNSTGIGLDHVPAVMEITNDGESSATRISNFDLSKVMEITNDGESSATRVVGT